MKLTLVLLGGLLSGCAFVAPGLYYHGSVTAISKQSIPPGLSFAVASRYDLTGEGPSPSATEEVVRQLIAKEMSVRGYWQKPLDQRPDLVVSYGYGAGAGTTHVYGTPNAAFRTTDISSSTTYARYLEVAVMRIPAGGSDDKPAVFWRSELNSNGTSRDAVELAKAFVPESFRHFNLTVEHASFAIPTF